MAKVSIITSAYNAAPYLEACAASVFGQSSADFEWILVDDGSTDATPDIIARLAGQDSRIVTWRHDNQGLGASRNAALDIARGTYFIYLDADDLIHPDLLSLCGALLDRYEKADFVSFGFRNVPEDHAALPTGVAAQPIPLVIGHPWLWSVLTDTMDRNNWNKMYRRETLGHVRYTPAIRQSQDIDYGWRLRKYARGFVLIRSPLYYYRQSKAGISRKGITPLLLDSIRQSVMAVHADYARDGTLPAYIRRFAEAETAKLAYKKLIFGPVKTRNIPMIKLGRVYIAQLRAEGMFHPMMLPWKYKIRYVLMMIRSHLIVPKHSAPSDPSQ